MITSYLYHSPKGGARRGLSLLPILLFAFTAQAQDTYTNERLINNSSDVIGTARYVGMGGALGALGADMSVISWNPAGIGLYRKNDIALTFGGTWGKSFIDDENRGTGTFDQAGFVYNIKTNNENVPYVNLAFHFQKKINYNHNFYTANANLGGLSQMDEVAGLTFWDDGVHDHLAGIATDCDFFAKSASGDLYNEYRSTSNEYYHHTEGSLQSFDLNLSTNIKNRTFLGFTLGVDNMRYRGWSRYWEYNITDANPYNHDLFNDYDITGTGINIKLGAIIRPFESSSLRWGVVVETPTWYRLHSNTLFNLNGLYADNNMPCSDIKFKLRSPWKVRTSIGSTVGSTFAWDVDYEFAAYANTEMGYWDYSGDFKDVAMNRQTRANLRGTHTLRAGIEVNATKNLAFRVGYNLSTSAYDKNISFNQIALADEGSTSIQNYATGTSYMRLGNTNILTLGMGYHYKKFYVDLAYKIRNQKADFYAFDTGFTSYDPIFKANVAGKYSISEDQTIAPTGVDLTRHAITCTLGFKF